MKLFEILFWPITAPIKFIQNNFKATLLVVILFFVFTSNNTQNMKQANLASIELNGPILDASIILKQIDEIKKDSNIKGVLFNINSPGGAVPPSIEIAYAIKELQAIKPVITYASGTIASGSYYASIWSEKIISNPGSMVGSIGVILQSMDTSELMQKIGIKSQNVKIGKYKEVGTPTRAWEDFEKAELEKVIKGTYEMFVNDVVSARKLNIQDAPKFADAHIFTAHQAKEVGLVDEVATLSSAKNQLIKRAKVKDPVWKEKDNFDRFFEKFTSETSSHIANIFANKLLAY